MVRGALPTLRDQGKPRILEALPDSVHHPNVQSSNPGSELLRTPQPRRRVDRGKRKGRSVATPALSGALSLLGFYLKEANLVSLNPRYRVATSLR